MALKGILSISNKGIELLGLNLSSEFSALLFGLSVFNAWELIVLLELLLEVLLFD